MGKRFIFRGATPDLQGVGGEEEINALLAEWAIRSAARAARAAKRMGPPVIELNGPGVGKKVPNYRAQQGGFLPSLSSDPNDDGSCPCCRGEEDYED